MLKRGGKVLMERVPLAPGIPPPANHGPDRFLDHGLLRNLVEKKNTAKKIDEVKKKYNKKKKKLL